MGIRAAGSAWASAHDLVRFGMFHLKDHLPDQEAILSDGAIDQMFTSVDPRLPSSDFHLPWIESPHLGFAAFHAGGHVHGSKVSFHLVPSEDIAVVVMSNGEEADTGRIARWVLNNVLPPFNWLDLGREIWTRLGTLTAAGAEEEVHSGEWAGELASDESGIPIELSLDGGRAWLRVGGTPRGEGRGAEGDMVVSRGGLFARFPVHTPADDASGAPHRTYFELSRRGDARRARVRRVGRLLLLPALLRAADEDGTPLTRARPTRDTCRSRLSRTESRG